MSRIRSDGYDKPFCAEAITIISNFKKALGDRESINFNFLKRYR